MARLVLTIGRMDRLLMIIILHGNHERYRAIHIIALTDVMTNGTVGPSKVRLYLFENRLGRVRCHACRSRPLCMHIALIAAMSADGKIAQSTEQSSLDWTSKEDTKFFVEKTKEFGTVIMGRKTFATIGKPLKERRLVILTHTPEKEIAMPGLEFTSETPEQLIQRLESEGCTRVIIAGGASVYAAFLAAGLVHECFLTIEPVLFGDGIPLAQHFSRINLNLHDVRRLGEQAVLLHYKIV